jgi:hypothetical protein
LHITIQQGINFRFAFIAETNPSVDSFISKSGEIASKIDDVLAISIASLIESFCYSFQKERGRSFLPTSAISYYILIIVAEQSTSSPCTFVFRCSACKHTLLYVKLTRYGFRIQQIFYLALGIVLLRSFPDKS